MQHPILVDGLQSEDGRSLRFADNAHLFQWPGALVYGLDQPLVMDEQQVFEKPTDWGRRRYGAGDSRASYPDRQHHEITQAPGESPEELRDRLLKRRTEPETPQTPYNPLPARGNMAAAFEARRTRDLWMAQDRDIGNPVLDELGIQTLAADFPESGGEETQFWEGARWVLGFLSKEFVGSAIIPPTLIEAIGPGQAGMVLAQYMDSPHAAAIVRRFQGSIWASMVTRVDDKLSQVRHELFAWARAGQLPVSRPGGGVDTTLTLANAATAIVGIYHLANLGKALEDFKASGQAALQGVTSGIQSKQ